jgi:hypothetical protein
LSRGAAIGYLTGRRLVRRFMLTMQQKIAEQFLKELGEGEDVTAEQIERLRTLMATGKKIKAEEFANVFSESAGEDVA